VNAQPMISSVSGDETIELELTPEQLSHLSQAAAEAAEPAAVQLPVVAAEEPVPPVFAAPPPLLTPGVEARGQRWQPLALTKIAAVTLTYVAFAWWSASQLAAHPQPPAVTAAIPPIVAHPVVPAASSAPVVKFVNPFDKTEVFEFPAGTTPAESREKVAQILMQRAQERQSKWEGIKPVVTVRTASLYRSP
jgi:hypothetical protein